MIETVKKTRLILFASCLALTSFSCGNDQSLSLPNGSGLNSSDNQGSQNQGAEFEQGQNQNRTSDFSGGGFDDANRFGGTSNTSSQSESESTDVEEDSVPYPAGAEAGTIVQQWGPRKGVVQPGIGECSQRPASECQSGRHKYYKNGALGVCACANEDEPAL